MWSCVFSSYQIYLSDNLSCPVVVHCTFFVVTIIVYRLDQDCDYTFRFISHVNVSHELFAPFDFSFLLFAAALPKGTKMAQLTKLKNKFRFLGRFLAKACMDSRMVDIPFSQTFYKCMLGLENELDLSDMQYVDRTLHKSLSQLYEVILQKKKLEDDAENTEESLQLALDSLTLDGVLIEDLGLDFVLPGTHIELKKGGKDIPVTIENLEEYLQVRNSGRINLS